MSAVSVHSWACSPPTPASTTKLAQMQLVRMPAPLCHSALHSHLRGWVAMYGTATVVVLRAGPGRASWHAVGGLINQLLVRAVLQLSTRLVMA